jgi:hypothetical protein
MDVVADVYVNSADVAGDFGVEFNLLIGLKLTSYGKRAGQSATPGRRHQRSRYRRRRRLLLTFARNEEQSTDHEQRYSANHNC